MAVTAGQTRYGAFYYGWFTSGGGGNGHPVSGDAYPPTMGWYNSSDQAVMAQHAAWALQAHIDTFICSDWGKGHAYNTYENTTALLRFLDGPSNPHAWLKACAMYELEQGDTVDTNPTSTQIAAHFEQLRTDMFSHASYRKINNRPVVFVYEPAGNASMFTRWMGARNIYEAAHPGESIYIGMEIWRNGTDDWSTQAALNVSGVTWFKYAAIDHPTTTPYSHTEAAVNGYSFTVSPGFSNPPSLTDLRARSVSGFTNGIASGMVWQNAYTAVGLGLDWILVNSFNELGEGTNIEPSTGFGPTTAEQSTYLDIAAANFPFPSTGVYPDFQISTVSTTTLYHDISDYIRSVDGVQMTGNVEQVAPFGQTWHQQMAVSKSMAPVKLEGFYDDTSGALARLHVPAEVGSSIYLRSVFGPGDAIESRCVVKSAQKTAKVRQLTGFALELALTGQPSTGIA